MTGGTFPFKIWFAETGDDVRSPYRNRHLLFIRIPLVEVEDVVRTGRGVVRHGSIGDVRCIGCVRARALLARPWCEVFQCVRAVRGDDVDCVQRHVVADSSVLDAMTELLGLKISQGLSGFDVFVAVPVMAKISEAVVCPSDGIVKATGVSHPALASFRLFGSFYGNSGAPRERIPFLVEESEWSDAVRGFIGKGHVLTSKIYEYLDLKLVHDELGEVYSHTWRTRELIPEQYVNPLYFLLMKFCSASKLHSLVVRPHSVPPQKTKPQKDFEQHVAWVLSCYGFATIVLGAHEDLVAEETKVKRGSLDLLAYHPFRKLVLLGACTLNVPKEEDYSQLVSVRTMLLEDWNGDLPFSCEVVMFTAAPDCPVRSNPTILDSFISLPTDGDVRVIDGNGLSEALTLLQERKEEQFFKRFAAMDLSTS